MSSNEIVEQLAESHTIENICKAIRVKPTYIDDLTQDICLAILLYDPKKLTEMQDGNQLRFFLTKVIKNQYYGGPFYRRWRKHVPLPLDSIMYKI